MSWKQDKAWSDRFIPQITAILGQVIFRVAPKVEDELRNSDLLVLKAGDIRVACRIRTSVYLRDCENEFTIRAGRFSGAKTELAKMLDGWGDFFFYGFSNPEGTGLAKWMIGDLAVFRKWVSGANRTPEQRDRFLLSHSEQKKNGDSSSWFYVFEWTDLPNQFVVAAGEDCLAMDLVRWRREQTTA